MIEQVLAVGLPGLGATLGLASLVWLISLVRRDASIVDIFWGLGFVALAWLYRTLGETESIRSLLAPALVTIWGVRLSAHVLWRNHGQGEDPRYAEMRRRWGPRFPLFSLPIVFWLQAALMWIVAMPLLQMQTSGADWSWLDDLGLALFGIGLAFEVIGDWQLARFKADPANAGQVMDRGLWRYTRHPNYFGDATLWWGLGCLALATPGGAWALLGPALMSLLLLRVSGVPLLEEGLRNNRPGYGDYIERTNAFFPWWPRKPRGARDEP